MITEISKFNKSLPIKLNSFLITGVNGTEYINYGYIDPVSGNEGYTRKILIKQYIISKNKKSAKEQILKIYPNLKNIKIQLLENLI